jgi:hypothetical protein
MIYLWAVIRTIVILVGVVATLLAVVIAASSSVWAFSYSFAAGFITLAGIAGVLSLCGHQLASVAKTSSTKRIGTYTRLCCGAVAVFGLVLSLATYGYVTVQQMREGAKPWENYTARSKMPALPPGFVLDAPQPQQSQRGPTVVTDPNEIAEYNAAVAAGTNNLPTCDDALIAAYMATRTARTGNVFDRFDPPHPFRPCGVPVGGNSFAGGATPAKRVIRFEGWEIRAPADTTDEAIVRVLDALGNPAAALDSPKSP